MLGTISNSTFIKLAYFNIRVLISVAHPCKKSNICDHLCLSLWNRDIALKSCTCASGYVLEGNKCIIKLPSSFLMLVKSQPFSIKGIDIESGTDVFVPITKIGRPKALDYSLKHQVIFFGDIQALTIEMAELKNTSNRTTLMKHVYCDGLAYDWISENLYWTSIEKRSVNVMKLSNTSISRTLIQSTDIIPSAIVVDPFSGLMYWADWSDILPDNGRIDVADMNGNNRKVFVKENIHWPAGLAIDFIAKRLYWTDYHKKSIESIGLDGGDRRVETPKILHFPVGLAVVSSKQSHFYFMEQRMFMSYKNDTVLKKAYDGSMSFYEVKLYDNFTQTGMYICGYASVLYALCLLTCLQQQMFQI